MSRIGKKPVALPEKVEAKVEGQRVVVKGPKGELEVTLVEDVTVAKTDDGIEVNPRDKNSKRSRAMWGMSRTLVANLVTGVTEGFSRTLEIQGVGYRAAMKGKDLQLQLGLSHEVVFAAPQGVDIAVPKPTEITISGIEKQVVGQTAAKIRSFRPPEPYKGKGIRYQDEYVFRKEGKKK